MYGLIVKLTTIPGKREELITILQESAEGMPGCSSYVVAKDSADENIIWVTEVWDSMNSHDASLSLPSVRDAIPRAKAIVSSFEKIAVTDPIWGSGLRSTYPSNGSLKMRRMSILTALVGWLAVVEMCLAAFTTQFGWNAGIGFLMAAAFAGFWARYELVRKGLRPTDYKLKAKRGLVVGYECLIIGSANALVGPHVLPFVATAGAAILIACQSVIFWLVFKNPRILRPVERPLSMKNLSARVTVLEFFYLALIIVGCAVFVPRCGPGIKPPLPIEFQWPGIALLYAAFGCLALGIAAEHSWGSALLYLAVALVAATAVVMELSASRNWYFLGLSLFAFFCLVPGWPRTIGRPTGVSLKEPAQSGELERNG